MFERHLTFPALLLASMLTTLVGCGSGQDANRLPVFPATGQISFQGKPVPGAFIVLHPKGASATDEVVRPRAQVKDDGTFELTSYETGDGAPAGEYVVTVQWHKFVKNGNEIAPGPNVLPRQYSVPEKSPLVVKIAEGPNQLSPIVVQ